MTTKNNKAALAIEVPSSIAILTPDGIKKEIARFRAIDPAGFEGSDFHTDSALLKNWLDQREASNDIDLTHISGLKKAAAVFAEIYVAAEDFSRSFIQAQPHNDKLNALQAELDSISSRIEHFEERDCRDELAGLESMVDELHRLDHLMERGSWRVISLDFREAKLKETLEELASREMYGGAFSEDGASARRDELRNKIELLHQKAEHQLEKLEIAELLAMRKKRMELKEKISEEEHYSNHIRHQASFAASRYMRILDAAEIRLMGLHQIYQLESFRRVG